MNIGSSLKQTYSRYRGYFSNIVALYKEKSDIKKYLELFLSLTAITTFSVFAIKPTLITIIDLVKEIKAKEEVIVQMDDKIKGLKDAQNVFYQNKKAIDILNLALPNSASPELVARQIEAATTGNSVNLNAVSYSSSMVKGENNLKISKEETSGLPNKTRALTITLGGRGDYEPVKNFISLLENLRRPFIIDSINLIKKIPTKPEEKGDILFSITGRVPYFNE